MKENVIKLNPDNILVLKIETSDGKDTGEELRFDFEDTTLFLRYEELAKKDKFNRQQLQDKLLIISKKEDVKDGELLTRNEREQLEAINEFFDKEKEVYNMFLGPRGVEKLLNGRNMTWDGLEQINTIINEQIQPYLEKYMGKIEENAKKKYANFGLNNNDEVEVLE